jgi:predicted ArsR family transcriptional regulator
MGATRIVRRVGHLTLAKTLKALLDGPVTSHEIAELTGIHVRTAQEWMRAMKLEGCVHIGAWVPDSLGRDSIPVYHLGKGKDKQRHAIGNKEAARQYRARKKKLQFQSIITGVTPCH